MLSEYLSPILISSMIIMGAGNTILFKYQNNQYECGQPFNHPFMQAFTMFIGEFSCGLLYLLQKHYYKDELEKNKREAQQKGLITKFNPYWLIIPAFSDFCTSTLQFFGLTMLDPSVYQMLRGGVIIVTAVFSKLFLRKKLYKFHYLGIFLVVLGISLVGTCALMNHPKTGSSDVALGITLILISLVTNGILFVSEEKIFQMYHVEPLKVTTTEGFWGIIISGLSITAFNFIKLPSDFSGGTLHNNTRYMERTDEYFCQIGSNTYLFLSVIGAMLTIAIFNASGVAVTKYMSSLMRSILDVTRTLLVWIIGLGLTLPARLGGGPWEHFHSLELLGFIILVLGNFVYNELIVFRFAGLDDNVKPKTKSVKNSRSIIDQLIEQDTNNE